MRPAAAMADRAARPPLTRPAAEPGLWPLLRYGALGLPLAFVALPLYVQWPPHAAAQGGLSLALLGALLLAVRVGDAVIDPWIGRRADLWFSRSAGTAWSALAVAAVLLLGGFALLFLLPAGGWSALPGSGARVAVAAVGLVMATLGYSLAQVVHQAWAARLGGDGAQQARWVGTREACALAGVLAASVLPTLAGWGVTAAVLAVLLALGLLLIRGLPAQAGASRDAASPLPRGDEAGLSPWRVAPFRRLLAVYLVNGLASALPASLVLFFVRDRVQAGPAWEAFFLAAYFGAAALAVPAWIRAVARWGLVRSWLVGMGLSILAFAGAVSVGAGETAAFAAICIASGLALGADLVVPAALLAGIVQAAGLQGRVEGRWFGWWSMAGKLNLALAAGLALPFVQLLGYAPGSRDPQALLALGLVYAVVPCLIKAGAALMLWTRRDDWGAAP